jgi:hypothetical protein
MMPRSVDSAGALPAATPRLVAPDHAAQGVSR